MSNLLIAVCLMFVRGNSETIPVGPYKDQLLNLHNAYRLMQGAADMQALVSKCTHILYVQGYHLSLYGWGHLKISIWFPNEFQRKTYPQIRLKEIIRLEIPEILSFSNSRKFSFYKYLIDRLYLQCYSVNIYLKYDYPRSIQPQKQVNILIQSEQIDVGLFV